MPNQAQHQIKKGEEKHITFQVEKLSPPTELLDEISGEKLGLQFCQSVSASAFASEELVDFGSHPFLQSMYRAYADHRPFIMSPDMIWLLVMQGFSRHINYKSEVFAQKWGLKNEKESLLIRNDDLRPDSPPEAWESVIFGFETLLNDRLGSDIVQEIASDFSTSGSPERIAGIITLFDSFKAYFEFDVFSCTCGIPSITLEGEQEDWLRLKEKILALKKYDLAWWIDELIDPLNRFISAFDGETDQQFWMDMFKIHSPQSCGDTERINGWITRFYPFDRDGRKRVGISISKINNLPDEIVKVDFTHHYRTAHRNISVPLQFVSGFVAASQNAKDFALRPHISWMIAHPKPEEQLLFEHSMQEGLTLGKLHNFPESLLELTKIGSLSLSFIDEAKVPDSIGKIDIGLLCIDGKISPKRVKKLARLLPNTYLAVNGKQYVRPSLKTYLSKFKLLRNLLWPNEFDYLDYTEMGIEEIEMDR